MRKFLSLLWLVFFTVACSNSIELSSEMPDHPDAPEFQGEVFESYNVVDTPISDPVSLDVSKIAWLSGKREIMIFDMNRRKVIERIKGKEAIIGFKFHDGYLFWTESGDEDNVVKYDLSDGKDEWRITGGEFASGPVIAGNLCIFVSVNGMVTAVSRDSAKQVWSERISGRVFIDPVVLNSNVVVAGDDGSLSILNAETGERLERFKFNAAPSVIKGIDQQIYVGTFGGDFIKIDASSNSVDWHIDSGAQVRNTPLITSDNIYWANSTGELYQIQKITGEFKVLQTLSVPSGGAPALAEQGILVSGKDKILYVLDGTTGEILKTLEFDGRLRSTPIYLNNQWIISIEDRWIYALE